jgi:hypothetical protein
MSIQSVFFWDTVFMSRTLGRGGYEPPVHNRCFTPSPRLLLPTSLGSVYHMTTHVHLEERLALRPPGAPRLNSWRSHCTAHTTLVGVTFDVRYPVDKRVKYGKSSAIFILKKVPERKEWLKIRSERGGVSYTSARKNIPERRSGFRPS